MSYLRRGFFLFLLLVTASGSHAQDTADAAQHLLRKAVEYYRVQGDAAFAAFSRQGEFIDGSLYVFVVDTKGTMLASGGNSAVLIGRDVSKVLPSELIASFNDAMTVPEGTVNVGQYRWGNPHDGKVELKKVYYERAGERILAVGEYLPHATEQQARRLLQRAAQAVAKDPGQAIRAVNGLSRDFREDDLYVFIIDARTCRYVAHGYNYRLVGVDFKSIVDPGGRPVGAAILDIMQKATEGQYDYRWKNPVTGTIESKRALLTEVGEYIVVVGYYLGDGPSTKTP